MTPSFSGGATLNTAYSGNDITIDLSIPGGAGIHQYSITIDTNETEIDLTLLTYVVSRSGSSNTYTVGAINTDMSRNWDLSSNLNDDTTGINLNMTSGIDGGDGTKLIQLFITANPNTLLEKGVFSSTYDWHLSISDQTASVHTYIVSTSATTGTGSPVSTKLLTASSAHTPCRRRGKAGPRCPRRPRASRASSRRR